MYIHFVVTDFEWDPDKRRTNLARHGIDFEDPRDAFAAPLLVAVDTRDDHGEDRWIGVGQCRGRTIVVVFTERRGGKAVRIISARKATTRERKRYEAIIHRLGPR